MVCTFRKLGVVANKHEVQLLVIDDSERSAVPTAQADTVETQGGVTKSKFGGGWADRMLNKV